MNAQELFDKVATHLLTQGEQSRADARCAYRGDRGLQCAVGCLIPDDKYSSSMEGSGISLPLVQAGLPPSIRVYLDLIKDLQVVHDAYSVWAWPAQLQVVADRHAITFTRPT